MSELIVVSKASCAPVLCLVTTYTGSRKSVGTVTCKADDMSGVICHG